MVSGVDETEAVFDTLKTVIKAGYGLLLAEYVAAQRMEIAADADLTVLERAQVLLHAPLAVAEVAQVVKYQNVRLSRHTSSISEDGSSGEQISSSALPFMCPDLPAEGAASGAV